MNGCTVDRQSGFLDCLGQSRVREHHHADVFGTAAELHGNGTLLDQLCSTRTNGMYTQYTVGICIGNDLDGTGSVVGSHGTTAGSKREHPNVDRNAFCLE